MNQTLSVDMNWRRASIPIGLVIAFIAILGGALLWSDNQRNSSASLRFLYQTNHPTLSKVGVFQFVNKLEEPLILGVGFYKPANRYGTTPMVGDIGTRPFEMDPSASIAAASTNLFLMWMPTNGLPYRAVLRFAPVSKMTRAFYNSRRVQIANTVWMWAKSWGGPTSWGQDMVHGTIVAESQAFEIKPPSEILTSPSALPAASATNSLPR